MLPAFFMHTQSLKVDNLDKEPVPVTSIEK